MTDVLAHALRLMSSLACGIVVIAFLLWAGDEGQAASNSQVAQVEQAGPGPSIPATTAPAPMPAAKHGGVRGVIDDANDALVSPFEGAASGDGAWPQHVIPALLALFAYGLLGRVLINYIPQRT